MPNKFEQLQINLNNICELNHFTHTHSLKHNLVGKEYTTLRFHDEEPDADTDPWKYKINKHGYRGNNWSFNNNSIAFFGCSITFGTGVNQDIATAVQNLLDINCHNLGQPGASAINILKTFSYFVKYHPVKVAVITLPAFERIHYPIYDEKFSIWVYDNLIPNWISPSQKSVHPHAYKFFNTDTGLAYLFDYIQMAELSAKESNTKIIWSSWDTHTEEFLNSVVSSRKTVNVGDLRLDKARDKLHPGPLFVNSWSNNIFQEIKKYL